MRRSICHCEPAHAVAGQIQDWSFIYTTASNLPKGTAIKFDLLSEGRDIDWEIPSVDQKSKENVLYAELPSGKVLFFNEVELPGRYTPQYELILPESVSSGENFTIRLGTPPKKKPTAKTGTQAQVNSQRRRPFHLYIDTTGKKRYGDPEVFFMDIRGGELSHIRILTPSIVGKNKRFDVVLRFEDEHGNLTSNCPDDTLIELSYEQQRESLSWKIFVPETGFITLPNLYFNEEGVYIIKLHGSHINQTFTSSPIKCFVECEEQLLWGLLHGESVRYDSTENIENCLRHFRDDLSLNYYAVSPFENLEETPNETWKQISQNVTDFDEADRFCSFLGFQWTGEAKEEGVRQFLYAKDNKPLLRNNDAKSNTLKKIYKLLAPKEAISIPTFTLAQGNSFDFKNFNPEFERVVEIYNAWGSSECIKKDGNPRSIFSPKKKGVGEAKEGAIIDALKKNCRFGFVAGGLDDRGIYQDLFDSDQEQYSPGMTGVFAKDFNKASIFEALYNRRCYGTTGPRIIIGLFLIGKPMGSELDTSVKRGLLVNRHLTGYVAGTTPFEKVEIIRCGDVIHTIHSEEAEFEFVYDDLIPFEDIALKPADAPPFIFYYLRVTQEDGHMAWSSPIWVDHVPAAPIVKPIKKIAKPVIEEEGEEEDDEETLS